MHLNCGAGEDSWESARRSNQSILKEINPEYSLEGLRLKLQHFDHLMWRANSLKKTLMLGKIEGKRRKGWQWDGWKVSLTQWTWVWANSRRQWKTEKPGMLQFMGWQIAGHNWVTEQQSFSIQPIPCRHWEGAQKKKILVYYGWRGTW